MFTLTLQFLTSGNCSLTSTTDHALIIFSVDCGSSIQSTASCLLTVIISRCIHCMQFVSRESSGYCTQWLQYYHSHVEWSCKKLQVFIYKLQGNLMAILLQGLATILHKSCTLYKVTLQDYATCTITCRPSKTLVKSCKNIFLVNLARK